MNEDAAPVRIAVIWSVEAHVDVRAIERETAMQILHCIGRSLASRAGDVKKLRPPTDCSRRRRVNATILSLAMIARYQQVVIDSGSLSAVNSGGSLR